MPYVRIAPMRATSTANCCDNTYYPNAEFKSSHVSKFNPRIDIAENDLGITFMAELPGVKKENVKVSMNEANILSIKGKKELKNSDSNMNYIRTESVNGEFQRSFELSNKFDRDSIHAKFEDGVLLISINKKPVVKPQEIVIE